MNWYIGQKIVAIGNHPDARFKKGQQFEIIDVALSFCQCVKYVINIGIVAPGKWGCAVHYRIGGEAGSEYYFKETWFAPIEPKQELSTHTTETLIEELEEQLQTA